MLNEIQKSKIERFINDPVMSESVYKVLLDSFLEPYNVGTPTEILAASRIALDMLPLAWKELEKFKVQEKYDTSNQVNIGL